MTTQTGSMVASLEVLVAGQSLPEKLQEALWEIEVRNDLYLPDVATLRFNLNSIDPNMTEIPDSVINDYMSSGKEIEIKHTSDDGSDTTVFKGEVTAVSLEFSLWSSDDAAMAVVQASDKSHRLHRGKQTRTFLNQKLSDIAQTIANEINATPQVDATSQKFDYVLQSNQTNWEFLWQMATRVGYQVYFEDDKLFFKKHQDSPTTGPELEWGDTLLQFRVRMSTASQVSTVKVKGWDWKTQQAIVGESKDGTGNPSIGESRNGKSQAATFGNTTLEVMDLPVVTPGEANGIAKSLADAIASGFVQAEGVATRGDGRILPGRNITISGVGTQFSGTYYVTSSVHRLTGYDGYTTSFIVSGKRPNSLAYLLNDNMTIPAAHRIPGVVTGVVSNLNDPDNLGRVKLKFPWMGDAIESDWVRIAVPDAGPERGFYWLPEVNDEVLVAFEFGDVQRPFIVGSLWSPKNKPPKPTSEVTSGGVVNSRIIKSRSGHTIVLDDTDGSEKIEIIDKTGKNKLTIDSSKNDLTIELDNDITMTAKGKVNITSTGDMTLESKANLNIKAGTNLSITAGANADIEAKANVTIKGLQTTVEGTTKAEVKGATANLTGQAMAEIKAALVKIN